MNRKDQIEEFLKSNPLDSFLLFALAKEYEKQEDFIEAIQLYETIKNNDQNYVGLYYHLGKAYEEIDQENKAITVYNVGIEIAKKIQDQHAQSEIQNALTNLELGL